MDNIGNLAESAERNRSEGEALSPKSLYLSFLNRRMYAKPVNKYPDNPSIILRISSGKRRFRATVKDVYNQLVVDMEKASGLLDNISSSSSKAYIGANAAHKFLHIWHWLGDGETNGIKHANAALKGVNLMNTAVYTADFCEVNSETLWAFECPTDDNQFYLSLPSFWYLCGDDYEDAVIGYSSLRVSKALINLMEDKGIPQNSVQKIHKTNDYISETGYDNKDS